MKIKLLDASVDVTNKGLTVQENKVSYEKLKHQGKLPDILSYIQKQTELTRRTITEILVGSDKLGQFIVNPQRFMDAVVEKINRVKQRLMIENDGIEYQKMPNGEVWAMQLFENEEIMSYAHNRIAVQKSVYDYVVFDSNTEREFAAALEKNTDIKLFIKLPDWFKISTPIGTYNPDWAIVKHNDTNIYMVRETKKPKNLDKLRPDERLKILCGEAHFKALEVDYDVVEVAAEVF